MKHLIKTIISSLIIFSCAHPNIDKRLLGEWENTMKKNSPIKLIFYKDSLITNTIIGHTVSRWDLEQNKINLEILKSSYSSFEKRVTYEYKFNSMEDTLTIMVLNSNPIDTLKFIRTD